MKTVDIGGKQYTLTPLDSKALRLFREWARPRITDPMLGLAKQLEGLPLEVQKEIAMSAYQERRKLDAGNSKLYEAIQETPEGASKILQLMFSPKHPELSEDETLNLCVQAASEHGPDYLLDAIKAANSTK